MTAGPLVVIGDALLDRDLSGRIERISPDAPVPVFAEDGCRDRPGGAALAAVLAAGGARPVQLVTAVGDDAAGDRLRHLVAAEGVELIELSYQGRTPEKIRLCAGSQIVLRLDRGDEPGEFGEVDEHVRAALHGAGAVLVSDYGRGLCRLEPLRQLITDVARRRPVVWDPHPRGAQPVENLRLITPNESELSAIGGVGPGRHRLPDLTAAAEQARRRWRATAVAVTLGAEGALLAQGGPVPLVVPAPHRTDGDACGAGDRFAGAAALALAEGAVVSEAVQAGVAQAAGFVAAGGARGYAGPARPAAPEAARMGLAGAVALADSVRSNGGVVVATGGCFDLLHAGHVATLEAARSLGDCLIVCINSDASVRGLKGSDRPVVAAPDRARLLGALACVDAVLVFDEPTPAAVLERLRPDVWVKGGDYFLGADDPTDDATGPALPEADLVRRWGGQCLVVPYLAGRSTSELIRSAGISTVRNAGRSARTGRAANHRGEA